MPKTQLSLIHYQSASAPVNMAADEQMLDHAHFLSSALLRFYQWNDNAFTFGYSQSWDSINDQANIPFTDISAENRIRRLTGGGLVDHRNDITYALAIPRDHPAATQNATRFYQQLHRALQHALAELRINTDLQPCPCLPHAESTSHRLHSQCFKQAEPYDLIDPPSRQKIAGAALRRNRLGLLVQGSLSKAHLPSIDVEKLALNFQTQLANSFQLTSSSSITSLPLEPISAKSQRYASPQWNTKR